MDNPNTYDDEGYTQASIDLTDSVAQLWEAGASIDNLTNEFQSALENATGVGWSVEITERQI